jgi:hypothetical protein
VVPAPASRQDQLSYLDVQFNQQQADRQWAPASARRLEDGLSRIAKSPRAIEQIECRSSLCRAHATEKTEDCEAFLQAVVHQPPPYFWEGPYMVAKDKGGDLASCSVTMYFGREGLSLPLLQ